MKSHMMFSSSVVYLLSISIISTDYNNCDRPILFKMWMFPEDDRFLFLQGDIFELIFWISLFQCASPFTLKQTGIPSSLSESVVNFMLSPSPWSLSFMLNHIVLFLYSFEHEATPNSSITFIHKATEFWSSSTKTVSSTYWQHFTSVDTSF